MNRALLSLAVLITVSVSCQGGADSPRTAAAYPPAAARPVPARDVTAALAFVRSFYTAYAPRAQASGLVALDSVRLEHPDYFTPALGAALARDAAARAAARGEIDGLDGDPFLNAQDPCAQYAVGDSSTAAPAGVVRVPVYAVCDGTRAATPAVIVEVEPAGTAWAVANVRYPDPPDDLLGLLGRLHP